MLQHTPLFNVHQKSGAKLVDFFGWEMPLHYGSQIEEHHHVRKTAGIFDVSHMGVVDIEGQDCLYFLRYLLANDVQKLKDHRALYTCMLNQTGGVVDDLIVYRLNENYFRLVVNAGTRVKDLAWMKQYAERYDVSIIERDDLAIIAIQGPKSLEVVSKVIGKKFAEPIANLKPFQLCELGFYFIGRTGYTGENGFEIILPQNAAVSFWQECVKAGAIPCGLGARDTLRLEAGLNLYGSDMDENTSPLVSNLSWTIDWQDTDRDFIGRHALQEQRKKGVKTQMVGLVMEEQGVLRDKQVVFINDRPEGEITSGSFSPTLGYAIALARMPINIDKDITVERRGKKVPVKIVQPPFVRFGKKVF